MTINDYMTRSMCRRFEWGTFDCCIYAAGAIEIATGENPMTRCPNYNDEVSASIVLSEYFNSNNVRDIFLKLTDAYDAHKVELHEAQNGDLVCIKWPDAFTKSGTLDQSVGMGVFYNNQVLACSANGLISVPSTHRIIDIWRF